MELVVPTSTDETIVSDRQDPDNWKDVLETFRMAVLDDPEIKCPTSDGYLIRSLRRSRFDIEDALKQIRSWCSIQKTHPHLFRNYSVESFRYLIEDNFCTVLKGTDHEGAKIAIMNWGRWKVNRVGVDDIIRACMWTATLLSQDDETQKAGFQLILDVGGISLQHCRLLNVKTLKFLFNLLENALPLYFKRAHVVNEHYLLQSCLKVVLAVSPEALKKKVLIHGKNYTKLHEIIPPSVLPDELGGSSGPFCNDHFVKALGTCPMKYI